MPHLSSKSDQEIEQWIQNHEKNRATDQPLYRDLLEERVRRAQTRQLLNVERSLEELRNAAIAHKCITYGDLAKASGVEWSQARHQMNGVGGHLDKLLDLCHARELPLLTAICVNQEGLANCELSDGALSGFVAGARRIGRSVTDERAFHHQTRDECWMWGVNRSRDSVRPTSPVPASLYPAPPA